MVHFHGHATSAAADGPRFAGQPCAASTHASHYSNASIDRLRSRGDGARLSASSEGSSWNLKRRCINILLLLVSASTLQAKSLPTFLALDYTWRHLIRYDTFLSTALPRWLLQQSNSLFRTSLNHQFQTISPIQTLYSKTPSQNGDTAGHRIIPRHERCTQKVSIRHFHCSSPTHLRHVRPSTCQQQTTLKTSARGLYNVPYPQSITIGQLSYPKQFYKRLGVCKLDLHLCNVKHTT